MPTKRFSHGSLFVSALSGGFFLIAVGCSTGPKTEDGPPSAPTTGVVQQAQDDGSDRTPEEELALCQKTCASIWAACLNGPCDSECVRLCEGYLGSCYKECETPARGGSSGLPSPGTPPGSAQLTK
jgi:hypothetical protein